MCIMVTFIIYSALIITGGLDSAMVEMNGYIDNVIKKVGKFEYASPRTPLTHMDIFQRNLPSSESYCVLEVLNILSHTGNEMTVIWAKIKVWGNRVKDSASLVKPPTLDQNSFCKSIHGPCNGQNVLR